MVNTIVTWSGILAQGVQDDNLAFYTVTLVVAAWAVFVWRSFPGYQDKIQKGELPSRARTIVYRRIAFSSIVLALVVLVVLLFDEALFAFLRE